jgi:hypothetical protein
MILYMRQYTWKHVMIVKSFIVGIGLNWNQFMNNINVYSPKINKYTFHGNWNPNFLRSSSNNYKLHEWQNHNWFDAKKIMTYYHKSSKTLECFNKRSTSSQLHVQWWMNSYVSPQNIIICKTWCNRTWGDRTTLLLWSNSWFCLHQHLAWRRITDHH